MYTPYPQYKTMELACKGLSMKHTANNHINPCSPLIACQVDSAHQHDVRGTFELCLVMYKLDVDSCWDCFCERKGWRMLGWIRQLQWSSDIPDKALKLSICDRLIGIWLSFMPIHANSTASLHNSLPLNTYYTAGMDGMMGPNNKHKHNIY